MYDNRVNVPCKGCEERHLKCHGTCGSYKDYKEELDRIKKEIRKQQAVTSACIALKLTRLRSSKLSYDPVMKAHYKVLREEKARYKALREEREKNRMITCRITPTEHVLEDQEDEAEMEL